MIDVNQVTGLVFHVSNTILFQEVQKALVEAVFEADADDTAIVLGQFAHGSGEITAAVANAKPLEDDDGFIEMIKQTIKDMSDIDLECPKNVILISDHYSERCKQAILKLLRANEIMEYGLLVKVYLITDENPTFDDVPITYLDDANSLTFELRHVLMEF